jgi:hypothetical protein
VFFTSQNEQTIPGGSTDCNQNRNLELWFGKNDAETSLAARPENVPRAMTLVMDYLNMWSDFKKMQDWQSIFLSNLQPRTPTSTHLSVLSPSPIVAASARSQASIILSDDDDVAIVLEDIVNVCCHNAEEDNSGCRGYISGRLKFKAIQLFNLSVAALAATSPSQLLYALFYFKLLRPSPRIQPRAAPFISQQISPPSLPAVYA